MKTPNPIPAFISLLIFCLGPLAVFSQTFTDTDAGLPYIRNYAHYEYNAGGENWSIVQDNRGIVFVANEKGILEYDGVSWRLITIPNKSTVLWLHVADNGKVYVGCQSEFGFLDSDSRGVLKYVSLMNFLPKENRDFADVWEVRSNADGIYFRTFKYIFNWNGTAITTWKLPEGATRFDMLSVIGNKIYFRVAGLGIYTILNREMVPLPGTESLSETKINGFLPYNEKQILIASRYDGLYLYDGKQVSHLKTKSDVFFKSYNIYDAIKLKSGDYAFATLFNGVIITDSLGNKKYVLTKETGLLDTYSICLYEDQENGLWIGLGNGLSRVSLNSNFTYFDERNGIKGNIKDIIKFKEKIYIATVYGVYCLDKNDGESLNRFKQISDLTATYLEFFTVDGQLWVSGERGIFRQENGKFISVASQSKSLLLYSKEFPDYILYSVRGNGFAYIRREKGKWIDKGRIENFDKFITAMYAVKDGVIMKTAFDGIAVAAGVDKTDFARSVTQKFSVLSGKDSVLNGSNLFSFRGKPVIAGSNGVFAADESLTKFTREDSLTKYLRYPGYELTLLQEASGSRWIVRFENKTNSRTFLLSETDGKSFELSGISFLTNIDRVYKSVYAEENGIIWFGSDSRLSRYVPHSRENRKSPISAFVRRVFLNGDSLLFGGETLAEIPSLDYNESSIRFEYSSSNMEYSDLIIYQYKFARNGKSDWSAWTTETKKDYTNLKEGRYQFQVRAKNIYGDVSPEAVFEIMVLPPWYRTWWAFTCYVVFGILFLFGFIYYRTQNLKNKNIQLETMIHDKTQQLVQAEKLASIGQLTSGLAHEINNPLTVILMNVEYLHHIISEKLPLMLDIREHDSDLFLTDVNRSADSALKSTNRIKIIVEKMKAFAGNSDTIPQQINLKDHIETIVEIFESNYPDIKFEFLSADMAQLNTFSPGKLNLAIYNVIQNSVHAIEEMQQRPETSNYTGKVSINCGRNDLGFLKITITDNGVGLESDKTGKVFDPFFTTKKIGQGMGLGLSETYATVTNLKGKIYFESQYLMGSTVTILFPRN